MHYQDVINFLTSHKYQIMESDLEESGQSSLPQITDKCSIAPQGWKKSDHIDFASVNLDNLVQQFKYHFRKTLYIQLSLMKNGKIWLNTLGVT